MTGFQIVRGRIREVRFAHWLKKVTYITTKEPCEHEMYAIYT